MDEEQDKYSTDGIARRVAYEEERERKLVNREAEWERSFQRKARIALWIGVALIERWHRQPTDGTAERANDLLKAFDEKF